MQTEVKETAENQNLVECLGEYGQKGGPGRLKSSLNKYSQLKKDILEVWEEESGKEKFRELFRGSNSDFVKALHIIIRLMPKNEPEERLQDKVLQIVYSSEKQRNEGQKLQIVE